ncbi:MAG: leucyl/phenylalanyl-tRNA--protein transferase [Propionibacteriaceae bacterium]
MDDSPFGHPASWRRSDLIGVSREFDADLVLSAYRHGVFPMPSRKHLMAWYSPMDRGILPLDGLRVTRSLRKMIKRYEIRFDTAFDAVLDGCADPSREGSWIDGNIRTIYRRLHRQGYVHSVEAWTEAGELAGGLYGVSVGGLFAGESMFHRPDIGRDASKAALVGLVDVLNAAGGDGRLLDVQWQTDHLASLGVIEIPRPEYLRRLALALELPAPTWPTQVS